MKHSYRVLFGTAVGLGVCLMEFDGRADAMSASSFEFTSGAVNWNGRHGQILDRLFAQDGNISIGSYQSMSDIVDPITRGNKTFSLFTSGLNGAPPPSASIDGSSISVDLSSLYLGWTSGSEVRAWNIGGVATGVINPQTSEFSLSWDHLFNERLGKGKQDLMGDRSATFFLQGTADVAQAPVPLSASVLLYATALALIGALVYAISPTAPAGAVS